MGFQRDFGRFSSPRPATFGPFAELLERPDLESLGPGGVSLFGGAGGGELGATRLARRLEFHHFGPRTVRTEQVVLPLAVAADPRPRSPLRNPVAIVKHQRSRLDV